MPLVFFTGPNDPRMISTIEETLKAPEEGGLTSDCLVWRYNLGEVAPAVPALIMIGRNDDVVPHETAVELTRNWCEQGTQVELRTAEVPAIAPGLVLDHAVPMFSERATNAAYLMDRVHDRPVPSSCGTV